MDRIVWPGDTRINWPGDTQILWGRGVPLTPLGLPIVLQSTLEATGSGRPNIVSTIFIPEGLYYTHGELLTTDLLSSIVPGDSNSVVQGNTNSGPDQMVYHLSSFYFRNVDELRGVSHNDISLIPGDAINSVGFSAITGDLPLRFRQVASARNDLLVCLSPALWRINPSDPADVTGDFGFIGNIPRKNLPLDNTPGWHVSSMAYSDGKLYVASQDINVTNTLELWEVDYETAPTGSDSLLSYTPLGEIGFSSTNEIPAGMTAYKGQIYLLTNNHVPGQPTSTIWRIDPSDTSSPELVYSLNLSYENFSNRFYGFGESLASFDSNELESKVLARTSVGVSSGAINVQIFNNIGSILIRDTIVATGNGNPLISTEITVGELGYRATINGNVVDTILNQFTATKQVGSNSLIDMSIKQNLDNFQVLRKGDEVRVTDIETGRVVAGGIVDNSTASIAQANKFITYTFTTKGYESRLRDTVVGNEDGIRIASLPTVQDQLEALTNLLSGEGFGSVTPVNLPAIREDMRHKTIREIFDAIQVATNTIITVSPYKVVRMFLRDELPLATIDIDSATCAEFSLSTTNKHFRSKQTILAGSTKQKETFNAVTGRDIRLAAPGLSREYFDVSETATEKGGVGDIGLRYKNRFIAGESILNSTDTFQAMSYHEGTMYGIQGKVLYSITEQGVATTIGNLPSSFSGIRAMFAQGDHLGDRLFALTYSGTTASVWNIDWTVPANSTKQEDFTPQLSDASVTNPRWFAFAATSIGSTAYIVASESNLGSGNARVFLYNRTLNPDGITGYSEIVYENPITTGSSVVGIVGTGSNLLVLTANGDAWRLNPSDSTDFALVGRNPVLGQVRDIETFPGGETIAATNVGISIVTSLFNEFRIVLDQPIGSDFWDGNVRLTDPINLTLNLSSLDLEVNNLVGGSNYWVLVRNVSTNRRFSFGIPVQKASELEFPITPELYVEFEHAINMGSEIEVLVVERVAGSNPTEFKWEPSVPLDITAVDRILFNNVEVDNFGSEGDDWQWDIHTQSVRKEGGPEIVSGDVVEVFYSCRLIVERESPFAPRVTVGKVETNTSISTSAAAERVAEDVILRHQIPTTSISCVVPIYVRKYVEEGTSATVQESILRSLGVVEPERNGNWLITSVKRISKSNSMFQRLTLQRDRFESKAAEFYRTLLRRN